MTKDQMLASGTALVSSFCERNGLETPATRVYSSDEWRFDSTCAYYRPVGIHIAPSRCAHRGTAGRAWSWPGYVVDRTPHGVMAHELGHHVDHVLSGVKGSYGGDFSVKLRALTREPKLTSYCPNDWEWFAEIFRLFATNPDLLHALRPNTYGELRERFEIVEMRPWSQVLIDAPERTVAQAWKKIAEVPRQRELL
jgi:hypothetical protein